MTLPLLDYLIQRSQPGAAGDAQLFKDMSKVGADGAQTYAERLGHIRVVITDGSQSRDFRLRVGEFGKSGQCPCNLGILRRREMEVNGKRRLQSPPDLGFDKFNLRAKARDRWMIE